MDAVNVAASVTRFKGSPVAVRASVQRNEGGLVEVSIVDSVLRWVVPTASSAALEPFFEAEVHSLDVDRATDPNKTVLSFNYIGEDGREAIVTVALTRGQLILAG